MKKLFLIVLAVALVVVGFQRIRHALRSTEEVIAWRIEKMARSFNAQKTNGVLAGVRDDFVDESSQLDFDDVRDGLMYLWFVDKRPLRATLDETDGVSVSLLEGFDPSRADVRVHCRIDEVRPDGSEELWWDLRVHGTMEEDHGNWWFIRFHEVNHQERPR